LDSGGGVCGAIGGLGDVRKLSQLGSQESAHGRALAKGRPTTRQNPFATTLTLAVDTPPAY
jgi:hypothetical protein